MVCNSGRRRVSNPMSIDVLDQCTYVSSIIYFLDPKTAK